MSVDMLVSRLDGVRRTRPDGGIARCPAHEDRSPSLSWRELADGRILLHCFAGCSVADVLGALGLQLDALYPPRGYDDKRRPRERRPFPAADALRLIEFELYFVVTSARKVAEGRALEPDEHGRLLIAIDRISNARQACGLEALR